MATAKKAVPEGYHTITPMLTFDEARKALDWYKKAFGAQELGVALGPDGKVMHGEMQIGDSRIMVHDVHEGMGKSPSGYGGSPASLWIYVDDCDALFTKAVAAGGNAMVPLADRFWGDRWGVIADPFGYAWSVASRKEDLTNEEIRQRMPAPAGKA